MEPCDFEDEDCCPMCKQISEHQFYKVVKGTERCPMHGGSRQAVKNKENAANQYRLHVWKQRLNEFTSNDQIKSLRDEVGILRIVLEETINKCQTADELLMFSARIASLAQDIGKLVSACDRLERNMGEMMDKPSAIKFAAKIIDIIGHNIQDEEILDIISHEILEELRN